MRVLIERHFAVAAIAAAVALVAQVIPASVLGAADADARGFLAANTTGKRHQVSISSFPPYSERLPAPGSVGPLRP